MVQNAQKLSPHFFERWNSKVLADVEDIRKNEGGEPWMRINNPKLLLRKKTQKDPQGRGSKQFKERLRGRIKIMRPRRPLASQESGDQQLKRIFLKKKTTNEQFPT